MKPKFESTADGLEIIDRIERHRYRLRTHDPVSPEPIAPELIRYPVDAAVSITAELITLPTNDTVYVRGDDGSMMTEARPDDQTFLPDGEYTLDLFGPLKTFLRVDSAVHIYSDEDRTHIALDEQTTVRIGARSYHTRPAGTITTTDDPADVMRAVSAFGSTLKTLTPERSFPTLRGHPPTLTVGDELDVPDRFEKEATNVRLEVPERLERIFAVTPLAYYLGADIVPGSTPRLATDDGFAFPLDGPHGFERTVERVLKQVFFLDCIVRSEGTTPLPMAERRAVEPALEFDVETAYERPLAEQLEIYLDVPYEVVEPHLPEWRLETRLKPIADSIEFLPFVADTLAIVRSRPVAERPSPEAVSSRSTESAIEEFVRGESTPDDESLQDSTASVAERPTTTIQQSWRSAGSTAIHCTTPLSAFYNSLDRSPRDDPIEIEVVCNDAEMEAELETVNGVYGNREELPFDVTIHYDLSTERLESVLAEESDFLHYIGHIDDDGFQCADGKLDASTVGTVGMDAFFLNACRSHDQGLHLIEAGSIGGIVTFGEVINSGAVNVGRTIARLLDHGFSLYTALSIARKQTVVGEQYRIVGDGTTSIAQATTDVPNMCVVDRGEDGLCIDLTMYLAAGTGKGSLFSPYLECIESFYLLPGRTRSVQVTEAQLQEFFELAEIPVLIDGTLQWSSDIDLTDGR